MVKRASLQVTQSQSYCKYHSIDFTCKKSSYKTDSHVLPMSYPVLWQPEVTPSLLDGTPLCDMLTLPPAPCSLPPPPLLHPKMQNYHQPSNFVVLGREMCCDSKAKNTTRPVPFKRTTFHLETSPDLS